MKKHSIYFTCISLALVFSLGVLLGGYLSLRGHALGGISVEEREHENTLTFVSPLLSCGEAKFNHIGNDELLLENDLNTFVQSAIDDGRASRISVYFRQLKGGPWVGIQEDTLFTPGSLLKVPLAMAVYEAAKKTPELLNAEILYESGSRFEVQHFQNVTVTPGQAYTVRNLIEHVLIHSDNNAAELLAAVLSDTDIADTYKRLWIMTPERGSDYLTNVHRYASFFRILYNATYVSPEDSEHLLSILARSTFTEGLVAGVPDGVVVAHKFGERAIAGSLNVQLHDCGIVYHPDRPYLLCVMTKGTDFMTLSTVIRDISRIAYRHAS